MAHDVNAVQLLLAIEATVDPDLRKVWRDVTE